MRQIWRFSLAIALLSALSFVPATTATAVPTWAPASSATIHPGVQTFTAGGQCTTNFVFFDTGGTNDVYIGQAAHCSSTGGPTDTDGCSSPSHPIGTEVTVGGASKPGVMVYNSWLTMQAVGETNPDICKYNDFALVKLDPADVAKVNPSVPHWGGPNGLNSVGTTLLQRVYSYGNSSLRLGLTVLSPKVGISNGDEGGGWSHSVSTVTPGIPGDSGSAFLDKSGKALGQLSTLNVAVPGGVTNGVGDLRRELDYLKAHGSLTGVQLALGTVAFNGNRVPLGL
ncbi:MAG TPA: hypothetical protein VM942_02875 [Acidimicrobiales bacterium]|nr:hypothetical protein [Acidimicrobiales bacterium]